MNVFQADLADTVGVAGLFDMYRQFYEQQTNIEGAYKFIHSRLTNKDSVIFVAKKGEEYVGFTQLYPTFSSISMKKAWIINDLFVIKNNRKSGIAQQLLQSAMELGRQTNASYLTLETALTNINAKKLYEKNGFVHDTEFEHYTLNLITVDNNG
ncbi:GNAT family N-acetyltransferase [Viridibacillus sp. FSL E2-0187]|uniref:GNAT family N-acetyltransferase n=1 Tax=Viridibacillus sp. FSL E2-0187 TaxID=2921362 RepID=UPI0030FA5D33